MNTKKQDDKLASLRRHKLIATGLFLLMMVIYFSSVYFLKHFHLPYIGYIKAFSEAAMVGALADWFAVTALFSYPLGLKIPHTNLIEKSKNKIGENLGDFVVENFLNSNTIRPYIEKLNATDFLLKWLVEPSNAKVITKESLLLIKRIINSVNDESIQQYIDKKLNELLIQYPLQNLIANGVLLMKEKGDIERIFSYILKNINIYIQDHEEMIKDRVKKESHFLIPGFVDNIIANKIIEGASKFITEIASNPNHTIRKEIDAKIDHWLVAIKTDEQWQNKLQNIKNNLLKAFNTHEYAASIWQNIKTTTLANIETENTPLHHYAQKMVLDAIEGIKKDQEFQNKINSWIRFVAFKYSLRNTDKLVQLITTTVGNWKGKALSEKLELEVGKDLQYIRVNGTIVGGIVGLLIYIITQFIQNY